MTADGQSEEGSTHDGRRGRRESRGRRSPPPAATSRAPTPRRWSPTRSGSTSRSSPRTAPASSARSWRARSRSRVSRRAEHEPLAYILGHEPFQGIDVAVDPRVLIPRRETGLLVEVAAELPEGARVHEIGTGSGAIALALLNKRPDLKVTASDLSPEAAEVARENAERLGIDLEVTVEEGLPDEDLDQEIDLVLANLPYVTDSTIFERSPEIRREPQDRRHRRLRRGRPRRDPRRARRDPLGLAGRLRARHPSRADDARDARRRDHPDRLHGWRAGDGRHRAVSEAAGSGAAAGLDRGRAPRQGGAPARGRHRSLPARVSRPQQDRGDPRRRTTPSELGEGEHAEFSYRIAGRVTGKRGHGKTVFFDVRDLTGDDPGLRPRRRARRGGLRADRRPRHRRHRRRRRRPLRDQARPAGARGARGDPARQGAARPARPLPRDLRPRHPLPPARARPDGERALARGLPAAGEGDGGDPRAHERARLRRAGDADPAEHDRRRRGAAVQNPPQRARPPPLPADRDRALPEAGDRRRLRGRLRARQVLPQRGDVAPAQPRVHDARVVRQRRRLQRRHGLRRRAGRRRRRAGHGHDQGRVRRPGDRLRDPLGRGSRCARR